MALSKTKGSTVQRARSVSGIHADGVPTRKVPRTKPSLTASMDVMPWSSGPWKVTVS